MVFRCPNIAGTTRSTHYSRTELRELLDPDNTSAKADSNNWTPEQGGWLRAKLRVDHVSTTGDARKYRSEEHTSELQSLMRISYAVFCLKTNNRTETTARSQTHLNKTK